jgi:hypothetical protein
VESGSSALRSTDAVVTPPLLLLSHQLTLLFSEPLYLYRHPQPSPPTLLTPSTLTPHSSHSITLTFSPLPTHLTSLQTSKEHGEYSFRQDAIAKGFQAYPFCLVMEAGDDTLKRIIDDQHIAGARGLPVLSCRCLRQPSPLCPLIQIIHFSLFLYHSLSHTSSLSLPHSLTLSLSLTLSPSLPLFLSLLLILLLSRPMSLYLPTLTLPPSPPTRTPGTEWDEIKSIMKQVTAALKYVHSFGYIHGDIKRTYQSVPQYLLMLLALCYRRFWTIPRHCFASVRTLFENP